LLEDLIDAVDACKTNADVKQVGIEWAIQQSRVKSCWSSVCIIILWENQKILDK
jgi:hypothetical protein